jgi:hypothetical protein
MSYVSTPCRDGIAKICGKLAWIGVLPTRPSKGFFHGSRIGVSAEEFKAESVFSLESNGFRTASPSRLHDCDADTDSNCESNQVFGLRKLCESSIGILSESKSHCIH